MSFAEHREKLYQSLGENTLVIAYAGIPIHTNEDEYYGFVVNSQFFLLQRHYKDLSGQRKVQPEAARDL